jgi:hypothetical protein
MTGFACRSGTRGGGDDPGYSVDVRGPTLLPIAPGLSSKRCVRRNISRLPQRCPDLSLSASPSASGGGESASAVAGLRKHLVRAFRIAGGLAGLACGRADLCTTHPEGEPHTDGHAHRGSNTALLARHRQLPSYSVTIKLRAKALPDTLRLKAPIVGEPTALVERHSCAAGSDVSLRSIHLSAPLARRVRPWLTS